MSRDNDYILELIKEAGLVSPEQLADARQFMEEYPGKITLLDALISKKVVSENDITMLLAQAYGLEVVDLKVSVAPEQFVDAAVEHDADIIAMSALLTTTMPCMNRVIEILKERGLRDRFIVMVGGAPVTQAFADEIGADAYTTDAASAAVKAKELA